MITDYRGANLAQAPRLQSAPWGTYGPAQAWQHPCYRQHRGWPVAAKAVLQGTLHSRFCVLSAMYLMSAYPWMLTVVELTNHNVQKACVQQVEISAISFKTLALIFSRHHAAFHHGTSARSQRCRAAHRCTSSGRSSGRLCQSHGPAG